MSFAAVSRTVTKTVLAVETPEVWLQISSRNIMLTFGSLSFIIQGTGALVRRSIGSMALRNLTPFLLFDHFHVKEGAVCVDLLHVIDESF